MAKVPFSEAKFKQIAGNCTAEYVNYMPREIKAQKPDGDYMVVVLCDYGYKVNGKTVEITPFKNRDGRNEEIYRLYHEEGLSQLFLANLFNMSQPSVSLIVKQMKEK